MIEALHLDLECNNLFVEITRQINKKEIKFYADYNLGRIEIHEVSSKKQPYHKLKGNLFCYPQQDAILFKSILLKMKGSIPFKKRITKLKMFNLKINKKNFPYSNDIISFPLTRVNVNRSYPKKYELVSTKEYRISAYKLDYLFEGAFRNEMHFHSRNNTVYGNDPRRNSVLGQPYRSFSSNTGSQGDTGPTGTSRFISISNTTESE